MYSNYRNTSIASFSSADSSNYDPTMSTTSLFTSPDISGHTNITSDFWSPSPPPGASGASFESRLPAQSLSGIVTVFQFAPQQGEPRNRITVSIGFKQLPGRVIGLRIVFGNVGLRTQVAHGSKKGHWQLRAEVPEIPGAGNPSSQPLKIEALEGDAVIDSVEFGSFTLWETGTIPAHIQNQAILQRRVRSFENRDGLHAPHIPRSSTQPYRPTSIASTLAAAAVSAPALTTAAPSSSSPTNPSPLRNMSGNPDAYRIVRRTEIPIEREAAALAVVLNIHGDLRSMSSGWTPEEVTARRRLVQFWRHMEGPVVNVHFCPIRPEEYDDTRIVISCIYREDVAKCYITSFDLIRLLEGIIGTVCNIDEKNRIRRNVHHIEHDTISKSKPYHEEFFDLIMSFPAPMPRRNVRDLKAFRWEFLPDALHAIMDKMALDYNPKAVSEMIEPSIPEVAEPIDSAMPTFATSLHSEPDRRDSGFSMDAGFSFRRPSAQSALSLDTISPNASVASFHSHQSPNISVNNFHLNHSPNASVNNFHNPNPPQFQTHPPNISLPNFHTQSPSASMTNFHHLSPSASVASFQSPANGFQFQPQQSTSPPLMMQDTAMDLSGMVGFGQGMTQGTPTGSFANLKMENGVYHSGDFYSSAGQANLNRVASHSSLDNALGGFYMT